MANLSQMCILPEGWDAPSISTDEIGMSKKLAWKMAKRAQHERMKAYREREKKRAKSGVGRFSLERDRKRVFSETYAQPISLERRDKMFAMGKGQLQPKKAKNGYSREQAGTIGRTIVVKRFEGSRLTCVCKSLIY